MLGMGIQGESALCEPRAETKREHKQSEMREEIHVISTP